MRIWITEIGEPLPIEPQARLFRYGLFTRYLARRGHEVTWWASTFSHMARTHVVPVEVDLMVEGVRLRLLPGPGYRRNVSLARVRHQRDFARQFVRRAQEEAPPDVLLSPIPTLEVAERAVQIGRARGFPVVVDVRDEWPEEFVDLTPRLVRPVTRLALAREFARARYACGNATALTGVSRRFLGYGLRMAGRSESARDGVFPLGYSLTPPDPARVADARQWWLAQGVDPSAAVFCFFGTIGQFFQLDTVVQVARALRATRRVQFVLCGTGDRLPVYQSAASGLDNVVFPGRVDEPRIAALMEMSLAGLAPYKKGSRMSLPNKPFEYFSGRLPVVSSIQGELTDLIADHGCGITYDADSVAELRAAVERLDDDRQEAREMGRRGRQLLEREFATDVIFERMARHFEAVAGMAGPMRRPG
jgi:glycosyltransferase involved in cell wall biosynthesis